MKQLLEDFLDDQPELLKPQQHELKKEDSYKFNLYCGSSVDITSTTPNGHDLLMTLQRRMKQLVAVMDALGIDYYWDGQMYINREEYIKAFEDDAYMLKPISIYYGIDHNSLNIYDADMCAGYRILLNPLPSFKAAIEFFYAVSNLFEIYGQYSLHQITYIHERKFAFTYFGFLRTKPGKEIMLTHKSVKIFVDALLEGELLQHPLDADVLCKQFCEYCETRPNFKFKVE